MGKCIVIIESVSVSTPELEKAVLTFLDNAALYTSPKTGPFLTAMEYSELEYDKVDDLNIYIRSQVVGGKRARRRFEGLALSRKEKVHVVIGLQEGLFEEMGVYRSQSRASREAEALRAEYGIKPDGIGESNNTVICRESGIIEESE